ncbi:Adaptive-response sensory-kinase SasA [Candidatus Magnetaquicoccaceae bacterium FCR-1]|uniref:histidine kinase n=1 Tax=Candidatus Magnetaquiglobus chichijimensis TaxID=3141448 RepID=A0ABQ0C9M1_9PROT
MRLNPFPNSLSGRIVTILLTGVFLALASGAVLHLHDRSRALSSFGGMRTAQEFVAIVHLLDTLPPSERRRVAALWESPLHSVRFLPPRPPSQELEEGANDPRAERLVELLRRYLGPKRPLRIVVLNSPEEGQTRITPGPSTSGNPTNTPPGIPSGSQASAPGAPSQLPPQAIPPPGMRHPPHYWRHMRMMQPLMPLGVSFLVRTQLVGGDWVEFHSHLPGEVFEWPEWMGWSLLLLFVLVGMLSLAAMRLATRPLLLMADAARALGQDLNHAPLPLTGPREVRHAASAFNAMQERLKRYVNERTHLLAAVSHDLKTPLTRMRLRVERLEESPLREDLLRNLTDMERMTSSALEYARGMEGMEPVARVDITALLEGIGETFEELGHTVEIHAENLPPFPVMPKSLKRCLVNLVDNAVHYGQKARMRADLLGDRLRISIADSGPGIPEADWERVFEPFTRLENSRNRDTGGTGLGLPIARNIVRAHGGNLTLRNRPDGGLEVIVTIPRGDEAKG